MKRFQSILGKINLNLIDDPGIHRVVEVLRTGFLSKPDGGPVVQEFQKLFATALNKKYAFAVTSGTAALHCAILALELRPGDEIIVPALSNIADCSSVIQEGAHPIFADIHPHDFNIDPSDIERKISSKTRAIIVVHMYGQPVRMAEIQKIAARHHLAIIEDCAQAAGAKYHDEYVGTFGDISCFSFYQTKHITCGEGGLVAMNKQLFARIVASVTNNGIMKENLDAYDYDRIGFNYQLTEVQAALGIVQFKNLDERNRKRRKNAHLYKDILYDTDLEFQLENPNTENAYFYLTGLLPERLKQKRDEFLARVKELDVPIKKLYPLPLPDVSLLKDRTTQTCPVARQVSHRLFNLYVNPELEENDIVFMANNVKKAYKALDQV